jgi:hypothetical protein
MALLPINITASTTLDDRHAGTTCTINAAAGLTITLPAASGSGRVFELVLGTTVTSNNVIVQVANANDTMTGQADMAQDAGDTTATFETFSNSDTITLNGSTKGGIKGDKIILKDIQSTLWSVDAELSGTGTEATPFSAAV